MEHTNTPQADAAYRAGFDSLCRIEGASQPSLIRNLSGICPDLATLAIRFVYGEIYPRPHLDLKARQFITVAALAALGNARPQLKFHIAGALNVGCSSAEIVELMLHLVIYAGFPAGLNGVFAAQEVFRERGMVHVPDTASAPTPATVPVGTHKSTAARTLF